MRHALVTGAAGFIGSHLVDRLLTEGWQVTAVDNFDAYYPRALKERNIFDHLRHSGYRLFEVDIRDLDAMRQRLHGNYTVLVHLAGRAGVRPSILDPHGFQDVNVKGTQNVLELAKELRIQQFVYASSSSAYGSNPNLPWSEEDLGLMPINPYASTKVSGEQLGHVYSHLYGMRFIALRLFSVYGPRQRPDLVIHKFAKLMLERQAVPVFGTGASRRDWTFVDDAVGAIRAAMDYRRSPFEVMNIGSGRPVVLTDVVRALENALGLKAAINWQPLQPGEMPQTWAAIDKARRLLRYEPKTSFSDGVTRFADWLIASSMAAAR